MRLPEDVLAIASDQAARMGVSANSYILMAIRNFIPYQEKLLQRQQVPPPGLLMQGSSGGKVGRNDPCPCGSGKKAKLCHGTG